MVGEQGGAQLGEAVERQRAPERVGQGAQDRPVGAGVARRIDRLLAMLDAALEIDVDGVLLAIGGAGQDHVGRGGAAVAMMADIDLEAALEGREIQLVRAEKEQQFRGLGRK